jgi:hypothetical protein
MEIEYEVIWNGGELLMPRNEGCSPIWRNMLTETEAQLVRRVFKAGRGIEEGRIHSGRLCACGCGQEMTYAAGTKPCRMRTQRKVGHHVQPRRGYRKAA